VSGDRATVSQLEEALQVIRSRVQELEVELAAVEEARQAVTAGIAEIATDRDRVRGQAELERYRALEEARRNWEAREARLYARLEAVEEELRSSKTAAFGAEDSEHLRGQVKTLASAIQALVHRLAAGSRASPRPGTLTQGLTPGRDSPRTERGWSSQSTDQR
jgi:chromosome segregation ATPase